MIAGKPVPFVLCMSPIPAEVLRAVIPEASEDQVDIQTLDSESRSEALGLISRADVIIGDFTLRRSIDAEMVAAAHMARLIQQPSVGYEHIDLEAAKAAGIPVANTAGANAAAVAEHTIMFILCILKKALYGHAKTSQGQWVQMEMWPMGVHELQGKTLGIVGLGRTGKEVARRARAFGCEVIYCDVVTFDRELELELRVTRVSFGELLERSDIVSLHVPLTEQTRGMLGADEIARMKAGSILVNTARGEVADEKALAEALERGHLSGAGIDVFSQEPVSATNPLLGLLNVILSPHTAGATDESRVRILKMALANVRRVLDGEKPVDVVNGVE